MGTAAIAGYGSSVPRVRRSSATSNHFTCPTTESPQTAQPKRQGTPPMSQLIGADTDSYDTDVIPSSSPRILLDLDGRPPWLPQHPKANVISIPLP